MSNKLQSNQDKNHLYLLFETEGILQVDLVVNFISVVGGGLVVVGGGLPYQCNGGVGVGRHLH